MKRFIKKFLLSSLVITTFVSVLAPIRVVKAEGKTLKFNFTVGENEKVRLSAASERDTLVNENTPGKLIAGYVFNEQNEKESFIIDLKTASDEEITDGISVICETNRSCTVTVSNALSVKFVTPGGTPFELRKNGEWYDASSVEGNLTSDSEMSLVDREEEAEFNGDVYVVWECSNGGTCLSLLTGIPVRGQQTTYIKASDVINKYSTEKFNAFGANAVRGYILPDTLNAWINENYEGKTVDTVDFSKVDASTLLFGTDMMSIENELIQNGTCKTTEPRSELEKCVDNYVLENNIPVNHPLAIQPLGEPTGANSYTSYGDRQFKVTIYNEEYKGITLGDTDSLNYVPRYWSPDVRIDAIDLSNTSVDNPGVLEPNILETTINLDTLTFNNFKINEVKALEVPSKAVDITKTSTGISIKFNSNFYDKVVFELSDNENNKYYIRIDRTTLFGEIKRPDMGGNNYGVLATFYYDEMDEYSDYEIIATYIYKDGTTKVKVMNNYGWILEGFSDWVKKDSDVGGKNLKVSTMFIEEEKGFEENIKEIYFNIIKKGSTSTTYNGSFAGSGRGIKMIVGSED